MDELKGRHVTVNATGAIAAVLSDLGYPWQIMRGFSLVARAAGIVGHILEEQREPLGRELWDLIAREVPYTGPTVPAPVNGGE
jgi:citrate synthase